MWALQRGISKWKISKNTTVKHSINGCVLLRLNCILGGRQLHDCRSIVRGQKGLSHCFFEFSFSHVDMQDRRRKSIREQHSERQVSWTPLASVYLPILSTAKQCVKCKTIMPTSWLSCLQEPTWRSQTVDRNYAKYSIFPQAASETQNLKKSHGFARAR
jgi:hypothetical protein